MFFHNYLIYPGFLFGAILTYCFTEQVNFIGLYVFYKFNRKAGSIRKGYVASLSIVGGTCNSID